MYTERQILNSKTPKEYIDRCINSDVLRGRKIAIGREWLNKTGFTVQDIQYARHRHPYWKKKKLKGADERNTQRRAKYDFTDITKYKKQKNTEEIKQFLYLNAQKTNGKYEYKDRELAELFYTSIPGIQHLRRKLALSQKIIKLKKEKNITFNILKYFRQGEKQLRQQYKAILNES